MLQFIYGLGALSGFALQNILFKKVMEKSSPVRAITYRSSIISFLLILSSLFFVSSFAIPQNLYPVLLFEVIIGAAALLMFFTALKRGKAAVIGALAQMFVLVVIIIGVFVFGETLSLLRWMGAGILVLGGFMVAFEKFSLKELKLEKGTIMVMGTILGWGIYYSYIKDVVTGVGPFYASVLLETGIFIAILLYAFIRKEKLGMPRKGMGNCVIGGGIAITIATLGYTFSVEAVGIVLTAMMVAAVPVVNAIFARIFLKEELSKVKYASIVLLMVGLMLIAAG